MFSRSDLKNAAKVRVGQNRWMAVLVCLITSLCGVAIDSTGNVSLITENHISPSDAVIINFVSEHKLSYIIPLIVATVIILAFVYGFFIANIISVGLDGWFLRFSRGENPPLSKLFSQFRHYKSTLFAMALRDIRVLLWSMLFIVPGIIKSYSYALVPYLLHENPSLSAKQALRISETMMDGWKSEFFVFDISFFGWRLLSAFTFGLLNIFFVNPYFYTSKAMLYDVVKYDAVYRRRVVDPAVFNATNG